MKGLFDYRVPAALPLLLVGAYRSLQEAQAEAHVVYAVLSEHMVLLRLLLVLHTQASQSITKE